LTRSFYLFGGKLKIFLISPVANADLDDESREEQKRIAVYVASLEAKGHQVHWPIRDTKQEDPTGGYMICYTNSQAMLDADEIHLWYNETSGGSKFDMGVAFAYVEMMDLKKKIVRANKDYICEKKKSLYKVFSYITG